MKQGKIAHVSDEQAPFVIYHRNPVDFIEGHRFRSFVDSEIEVLAEQPFNQFFGRFEPVLDNLAARTPLNEATIEDSGGD